MTILFVHTGSGAVRGPIRLDFLKVMFFSDDATQSMLDHDTRKRLCKKLRRVVAEKRTAMASLLEISNIGLFGLWFQNR